MKIKNTLIIVLARKIWESHLSFYFIETKMLTVLPDSLWFVYSADNYQTFTVLYTVVGLVPSLRLLTLHYG